MWGFPFAEGCRAGSEDAELAAPGRMPFPSWEVESYMLACISEGALLASALSPRSALVGTWHCPRAGA